MGFPDDFPPTNPANMKPFYSRILVCLIPVLAAALIVGVAWQHYETGNPGLNFRLGVDLVGGTILVYEVDLDRFPEGKLPENYKPETLAASLKRRIDPSDLYNVTIRPVSKTRVEIVLPTGGAHQERLAEEKWHALINDAIEEWPALKEKNLDIPRGQTQELAARLEEYKVASPEEIQQWVKKHYQESGQRRDFSTEQIQNVKDLISQVGSLEFRILANDQDDKDAVEAAKTYIDAQSNTQLPETERNQRKEELETYARKGLAPPPPKSPDGEGFEARVDNGKQTKKYNYSWVELGKEERKSLGLDNASELESGPAGARWREAQKARDEGKALVLPDFGQTLLYSRKCVNTKLPIDERERKKFEYFVLTRDPLPGQKISGDYLVNAAGDLDKNLQPCVRFKFNSRGGDLFYDVTSINRPNANQTFFRHLAIILDGQIVSAPRLNEAIRSEGQITGSFTKKQVDRLVSILNSGALPATLKPLPVSENTIGATLGEDTIKAGTYSVLLAFAAVLAFMLVYYRFSGLVACIALFANLLLTVAFMVLVHATFTLPGLAGLVLMLGMAVDANVLIYERLREERDRGASIALAIRNGYDRAFPTIIDTHLSSIFTAIVLYAVGNDQLKGFGVSLTVGLIISLFTSLYMTRLMFDIWLTKGWLKKLSMFRLLSRTNIDFMRIRYYWFTATVVLTLFGITVFLLRGKQGLNIDFVGGTAYGGQLVRPMNISKLRDLLGEKNQARRLRVANVKEIDDKGGIPGTTFRITYADGSQQTVQLPNPAAGATEAEREEDVKRRAETLPDWSVEQIFLGIAGEGQSDESPFFNVRTAEKAPDLVQVTIDRLLHENIDGKEVSLLRKSNLESYKVNGKRAILTFSDVTSPSYVKTLLEREFRANGVSSDVQPFDLSGKDRGQEGRYKEMEVDLTDQGMTALLPAQFREKRESKNEAEQKEWEVQRKAALEARYKSVLAQFDTAFRARPPAERLENFDSQLAAETQSRAMWAILASWGAILLYLWFRFGNWTFGAATVICLIHDLFFTLGIIAFSHYIHMWMPGLATFLGLQDFKIDLPSIAALLTLVGYSVNDTIVVFDRIREVRGKNPELTPQMINDSVNQTLSRTLLTAFSVWVVVIVLYIWGGEGVHLFSFVMVVGVIVGTYSSIYIASPLLLIFGEGAKPAHIKDRKPAPEPEGAPV